MLGADDVLKVDIGVHVKGKILDSAFTLAFDHRYDKLLEAVKAATDTGVRVRAGCFLPLPPNLTCVFSSSCDRKPVLTYN